MIYFSLGAGAGQQTAEHEAVTTVTRLTLVLFIALPSMEI